MPSHDPAATPQLDQALDGVEGWFSPEQVAHLARRVAAVPATGRIVEIGSYRGRSMIVIASSAREGVEIYAIDPHAGNDRGPQEIEGFEDEAALDSKVFLANLERAGVRDRVTYVRKFSHDALDDVPAPVDLLHVDGAHRYAPASDDIASWGARVAEGGSILIHDSFSSVGVTLALVARLTFSTGWRYAGRSRSLAEYVREPVAGIARVANVARQLAEVPWFLRNLLVKALILAKLPWATRLLGHEGESWPY
ncbi:MAG TPA: class I SAM-dependent methyltransferase [Acidimicrobiales bacterium]|nr:class I SAM-dependent methyltransferase [Acidimicrobiales bacterium]